MLSVSSDCSPKSPKNSVTRKFFVRTYQSEIEKNPKFHRIYIDRDQDSRSRSTKSDTIRYCSTVKFAQENQEFSNLIVYSV